MRVLVTGGSGAIGAALARHTQAPGELDFVLADVVAPSIATAWPYVHLDVTDREACVRACREWTRSSDDDGAGRTFGQALCSSYAARSQTTFVAVRIGAFAASPLDIDPDHRDAWLSHRDAAQLLQRCVLAPLTERYLVVNGMSGNTAGRLSLDRARAALGYTPQDDASTWA